jgi:PRC-barrel domain
MEVQMALSAREMDEREFGNLIGSDKVEGSAVFGPDDNKIGSIERVMIDKVSGRVSYAVLGFGGFLGLGNDHYPLPWQSLKYDTRLGGYRTGITEDQLRGAPKFRDDRDWNWGDPAPPARSTTITACPSYDFPANGVFVPEAPIQRASDHARTPVGK